MKRISAFTLTFILVLMVYSPVAVSISGAAAKSYYSTDIVTYLWNTPINSINIGGVTLIDAESMSHYGFTVNWHSHERWLEITHGNEAISPEAANGSLLDMKSGSPGEVAGRYYYTDIKTTLNGEQIISYNIGGRTFIGAEAMRNLGYNVIWDNNMRALTISNNYLSPAWEWEFTGTNETLLSAGFTLEFANATKNNEIEFTLIESSGEYGSIGRLVFSDSGINLVIYMDVKVYGEFWKIMQDNRNIIYGERRLEDTPERRAELARVFRVFVNGAELGGEMSYTQGNGHSDYTFIYDKPLRLEEVKTLRLEVGYKQ